MSGEVHTLFGSEFKIGATYPDFQKLSQIKDLARASHGLVGTMPWLKSTTNQAGSAEADIRAGFIGNVCINEVSLQRDGKIIDRNNRLVIDGLLFHLDLTYAPTGRPAINALGGLAIGNGKDMFEIRAYDLEQETFGKLAVPALKDYLERSKAAGGSTTKGSAGRKNQPRGTLQG